MVRLTVNKILLIEVCRTNPDWYKLYNSFYRFVRSLFYIKTETLFLKHVK